MLHPLHIRKTHNMVYNLKMGIVIVPACNNRSHPPLCSLPTPHKKCNPTESCAEEILGLSYDMILSNTTTNKHTYIHGIYRIL